MSQLTITAKQQPQIAELEEFIAQTPAPLLPPVIHEFTPGLYCRTMEIPHGIICTSRVHKTTHQYNLSRGVVKVWEEKSGWEIIQSPHRGTTEAGVSRVVIVLADAVWSTYHATEKTDIAEIEKDLFEVHEIPQQVEGPCLK